MPKTVDSRSRQPVKSDRPPVDALTVGWMLTLITTLLCLAASIAARAFVRFVEPKATMIGALSGLMLFAAAVIGLILLVLTPIIVKRKRSDPPRGLVVFAYIVGIAPLVSMILQGWE